MLIKEACIRDIVLHRLGELGLGTIRLPLSASIDEPHVPILASKNLAIARRVVVVFGESFQDLGIWAQRSIGMDGIDQGSTVAFAKAVLGKDNPTSRGKEDVALVLANTGQLIWHCGSGRAVTHTTWRDMPRESAVDEPPVMTYRNTIPRNKNWQEHVECVFNDILASQGKVLTRDAKVDIIGVAKGGLGAFRFLNRNCMSFLILTYLPPVDVRQYLAKSI